MKFCTEVTFGKNRKGITPIQRKTENRFHTNIFHYIKLISYKRENILLFLKI